MARRAVRQAWANGLRPEESLTVAEWADKHRYLSGKAAAEPGKYRVDRTPYVREPLECLSVTSPVQRVVLMWGAQVGKSETGNNFVGYVIDNSPGPMLLVQPRVEDAEGYSKDRIEPMIDASPRLRKKVPPARERDSGNTVKSKQFPGGVLVMTGANSAAGLRSRPIRYLFMDEVDLYPSDVGGEGDPVALAERRTNTFRHRRKILLTSTPTIKGVSRIEKEWEQSDKRMYHVPCPECEEFQVLKFENLKWPKGDPQKARYMCEHCGCLLGDEHKTFMLANGEWRATDPGPGKAAGFHLNSLYSPVGWLSWVDIVQAWEKAQGKPEELKTFINTILAETWAEKGEAPEWERLYERREDWPIGRCPDGVALLTAGVDVQKDRIEAAVWGWGRGRESWLIETFVFNGDPYQKTTWEPLTRLLQRQFETESGAALPIARMAVDSGYATDSVYDWAKGQDNRVMVIKGEHWKQWGFVIGAPDRSSRTSKGKKVGIRLYPVGGAFIKQETYGFFRLPVPLDGEPYAEGYIHLPKVDEETCKQLVSEHIVVVKAKNGFQRREWEKTRDRNEQLDMRVYARAAAELMGVSRMTDAAWDRLYEALAQHRAETGRSPESIGSTIANLFNGD